MSTIPSQFSHSISALQSALENSAGKKLELKINDNRSTMVSVRWGPNLTRVSLHRMFLQAPQNIMESLACYLKGGQSLTLDVRSFIETNLRKLDYSHLLDQRKLCTQGHTYNLLKIYHDLNAEYFDSKLKLAITWFGKPVPRAKTRILFGLYYDPMKLVKIHRVLDSPSFPDYVVAYIVYHEMLHHVCPSYYDEKGIHRVHGAEFKAREKRYRYYSLADRWIQERYKDNYDLN